MDTLRAAGLAKNFHVDSAPFDALALLGGKIEYAIAAPSRRAPGLRLRLVAVRPQDGGPDGVRGIAPR